MSKTVYTYVTQRGNTILSRGYHANGERFNRKDTFTPTLFVDSKKGTDATTEWKNLDDRPVYPVQPGTIKDCREFVDRYKEVSGFNVYGMTNWVSQFIAENYEGEIKFDITKTRIWYLDIETSIGQSFPKPEDAEQEILLISVYDTCADRYTIYTAREHDAAEVNALLAENKIDPKKVVVSKHNNEYHLLKHFVIDFSTNHPDAISGWNIETFDVPYLVRRIMRVLGDTFVSRLSPWGSVRERFITKNDNKILTYDIEGVAVLDYYALMRKFTYGDRESWKLGDVAQEELGQTKLEIEGTFKESYSEKNWNKFVAYNLIDTHLVYALDKKMQLMSLIYTVAYIAKVNPDEVFSPIRTWDAIIYNHLREKKTVVPLQTRKSATTQIAGGYVKDPQMGKHEWLASYDFASLYPSLIMTFNISPDTLISDFEILNRID